MANTIIAVNRQSGSGGAYIGAKAAEVLGISCYDKEILQMALELGDLKIARHEGVFQKMDERKPNLAFYRTYKEGDGKYVTPDVSASDQIFDLQKKVMTLIAEHQDAVFIGRCSNWVFQRAGLDINLLSVFIMASPENRIQRVLSNGEMNEAAARRFIKKTDRQRDDYYYYMTHTQRGDYNNYDMILNSGAENEEKCIKMICGAYEKLKGI